MSADTQVMAEQVIEPRAEPFIRLERADWLLILALTLLAAAIRFYQLGGESLWLDEATTFFRSSMNLHDLTGSAISAGHTPTYFLFVKPWLKLGSSEFVLRAPSALFSALTVPLCYALGQIVGGRRAAILTALLVTISVFQVSYAQEARSYALLTFCVTVAMLGLAWLVQQPERAVTPVRAWRLDPAPGLAWGLYVFGMLGALATHNMAIFFLVTGNAVFALLALHLRQRWGKLLANWLLAHAAILLLWIWWWPVLLRQGDRIIEDYWIPEPTVRYVLGTLRTVYADAGFGVISAVLALFALLGVWAMRRRPWTAAAWVLLLVVPPLALLAITPLRPLFYARHLVWAAIPFFVLAGVGIAAIRPRLLFALALAALVVEGAVKLGRYYEEQTKPDWRGMTTLLVDEVEPDGLVAVAPQSLMKLIDYYRPRIDRPPRELDFLPLPRGSDGRSLLDVLHSGRPIWLVIDLNQGADLMAAFEQAADWSQRMRDLRFAIYRLDPGSPGH